METRYISLEPLAFDEGIYRENLMKGGVKQREYSIIIVYNASCSLSACFQSVPVVCVHQAAKPLGT